MARLGPFLARFGKKACPWVVDPTSFLSLHKPCTQVNDMQKERNSAMQLNSVTAPLFVNTSTSGPVAPPLTKRGELGAKGWGPVPALCAPCGWHSHSCWYENMLRHGGKGSGGGEAGTACKMGHETHDMLGQATTADSSGGLSTHRCITLWISGRAWMLPTYVRDTPEQGCYPCRQRTAGLKWQVFSSKSPF